MRNVTVDVDELGRCEDCGRLVPEDQLEEIDKKLTCDDCDADPDPTR